MTQKKTFMIALPLLLSILLAGCSGNIGKNMQESASAGAVSSAGAASVDYADQYVDLHLHLDGAFTTDEVKNELRDLLGV